MKTHAIRIAFNTLAPALAAALKSAPALAAASAVFFGSDARAAEPSIRIDYLPPLGSGGNAEGRVEWDALTSANASQYAVIGMLNVYDTYVKPSWDNYLNAVGAPPSGELGAFNFMIAEAQDGGVDPLVFYLVERADFAGIPGNRVTYSYMATNNFLAKLEITRSAFWASRLVPPAPSIRPSFLPAGTAIALSAPAGAAMWVTTDGSCPTSSPTRAACAATDEFAVPAQGCLILNAASESAGEWSSTATYTYFPREDLSRVPFFGLNVALNISNEQFDIALTQAETRARLQPLRPLCRWIRTFGTIGAGQEFINAEARGAMQFKTMIGVYITNDPAENAAQLNGLAAILDAGPAPDIIMAGNECSLAGIPTATLLECIDSIRALLAARGMLVPVGTVDIFGARFDRDVLERLDLLGLNFYPATWDDTPFAAANAQLQASYAEALASFPDKLILLTETGVPSGGGAYIPLGGSVLKEPTPALAAAYLDRFLAWTRAEHIPSFYFQAYRQPVKSQGDGHPIEQYFGLMDAPGAALGFYQPVLDKWSPFYARIAVQNGSAAITWFPSQPEYYTYAVETTDSLVLPNWTPLPPPHVIDTATSPQRFFKVQRIPVPAAGE